MTPALELRGLACVRGGRCLFRGLQVLLSAGQLMRVHGANGSGKTSLLRVVCGLLPPARGEVWWRGRPLDTWRETLGQEFAYIGHTPALNDDLTAHENLHTMAAIRGHAVTSGQANDALAQAGLASLRDVPARHLSQGQRRRVALARLALPSPARLWVLDEPFNALDATASAWLDRLLATQLQRGGSIALTSHLPVNTAPGQAALEVAL